MMLRRPASGVHDDKVIRPVKPVSGAVNVVGRWDPDLAVFAGDILGVVR
jgi:hypothetical protein